MPFDTAVHWPLPTGQRSLPASHRALDAPPWRWPSFAPAVAPLSDGPPCLFYRRMFVLISSHTLKHGRHACSIDSKRPACCHLQLRPPSTVPRSPPLPAVPAHTRRLPLSVAAQASVHACTLLPRVQQPARPRCSRDLPAAARASPPGPPAAAPRCLPVCLPPGVPCRPGIRSPLRAALRCQLPAEARCRPGLHASTVPEPPLAKLSVCGMYNSQP